MFVINNKQFEVFAFNEIEKFINNTIKQLTVNYSEYTKGIEPEELKAIVNNVIAICKQNNVITEEGIFLMIVCNVKYKFKIPLHASLKKILDPIADERLRVEAFVNAIASGRYNLIEVITI
jgi:beta-glucosidase/6-phospho-beta-glucosidase/beta-galactosidase